MTDLAQGVARRHLINMATPMMIGLLVQGPLSFSLLQRQLKKMPTPALIQR